MVGSTVEAYIRCAVYVENAYIQCVLVIVLHIQDDFYAPYYTYTVAYFGVICCLLCGNLCKKVSVVVKHL